MLTVRKLATVLGLSYAMLSSAFAEGRAVMPPVDMVRAYVHGAGVTRDDLLMAIIPGLAGPGMFMNSKGPLVTSGWSLTDFIGANSFAITPDKKTSTYILATGYDSGRGEKFINATTGSYMYEVQRTGTAPSGGNDNWGTGFANPAAVMGTYLGSDTRTIGYWDGYLFYNGGSGTQASTCPVGGFQQMIFNFATKMVTACVNGVVQKQVTATSIGSIVAPMYMCGTSSAYYGSKFIINTGDKPFAFPIAGVQPWG